MKIDNLDRMELSLINKISKYRDEYYQDLKIIFFDFPRASNMMQVMQATELMEDAKSGYLESNFGGKHRDIKIGNVHVIVLSNTAPDLSVLSVDRLRLGGEDYENVIWPCKVISNLNSYDKEFKTITWSKKLENFMPYEIHKNSNFEDIEIPVHLTKHKNNPNEEFFGASVQYTKSLVTTINETPNYIKYILNKMRINSNDKNIIKFD
jgi:hypothetical protein